ncbi:hypothetical protein [Thalassospira alkalitolerans]|uniref:hypothetical protein n=1 Tax=Thalassospira alkalitolerans TaxID=1293890 RepID=UPI003AA8A1D9
MNRKSSFLENIPDLLHSARWLIDDGYEPSLDGEYFINFKKGKINIQIYYGHNADPSDVGIIIDTSESHRHENGYPVTYSVFESICAKKNGFIRIDYNDKISHIKRGLNILKDNPSLFEIGELVKIRNKYNEIIKNKMPLHIRKYLENSKPSKIR